MTLSNRYRLYQVRAALSGNYQHWLAAPMSRFLGNFRQKDIAIFFEFVRPPYGGGNQFLTALWKALDQRGYRLENNTISRTTRACLFNSHHFSRERLRILRRPGCRMVHRVDGPISIYRGHDDGTDQRILQVNHEFADVTIFQSQYSLSKHRELGMAFKAPTVIMNACDPGIFHIHGRMPFDPGRKIRLISNSWSSNINKGALVYQWIEKHLDWQRFEYTFVGNSPVQFEHIRMLPALPSGQLAQLLRQQDIFITATQNDACSNSLIEALACGLPAIYLDSGGSPEIVGEAGFGFSEVDEIPALLERLVQEYIARQAQIHLPTLAYVAERYLEALGIKP